ncbi:hypothetical protein ACMHYJ_14285 [Castellaniella hirudinis]|uniref:hypothetical protein n=1 Tax=Castellaniella hirudinis TaxID=1144617 RepID=UPI0039C24C35
MILNTHIQGIPCQVSVTHYTPADPGRITGPVDRCYPPEPAEVEFDVLDRRGRPAPWLERKMGDADARAVEQEIIAAHESAAAEAKAEARIEALEFKEWGAYA